MLASFLSFVVASLLYFAGTYVPEFSSIFTFPAELFQAIFAVFMFLSLSPWLLMLLFSRKKILCPVTQASARSCYRDNTVKIFSGAVFLISIVGLVGCSQTFLSVPLLYALALIEAGIIIDLLKYSFLRLQERSSPAGVADWLLNKFKRAASQGEEKEVIESFELIFSLLVTYAKQGDISSMKLFSLRVVGLIEELLRALSQLPLFMMSKEDTLLDRYGVAEAMTAKRLAWTMKVTGGNGNPTALEETMRLYGKLFMVFHNYHDSLGHLLLVSLSQNLFKMAEPGEHEKDVEYMMVCSEIVKSLIDRANDRRISEKASIMRVLNVLETHVRECFRRDRSMSPAFLMQPFAEVGQLLGSNTYAALPDRDDILSELRRILTQFSALETVSTRLESGEPGTDTKATYHEDLPFQRPVEG